MYWRTNPIKHNVTTVLGSADWWTFKRPHSCRFCALYHHIHQLLKRAQTSLPFTGLSWFVMLTLHVKWHNSSPHESCLMTSCNPVSISVTTSLQLTCCELHLQKQPGCDLYSALPHDIKSRNETNIHPWKEQTTDRGERPSDMIWICSCSMKRNRSNAVQMGLKGRGWGGGGCQRKPSFTSHAHRASRRMLSLCGFVFWTKSSWDWFLKQSWKKREKRTWLENQIINSWLINKMIQRELIGTCFDTRFSLIWAKCQKIIS